MLFDRSRGLTAPFVEKLCVCQLPSGGKSWRAGKQHAIRDANSVSAPILRLSVRLLMEVTTENCGILSIC